MSTKTNFATSLRAKALALNTVQPRAMGSTTEGKSEVAFVIAGAQTAVVITDTDSVTPANDAPVPHERLVFNNKDIADGSIVLVDAVAGTFNVTAAKTVVVGVYESAQHDGIKCSVATTVLASNRNNPAGV